MSDAALFVYSPIKVPPRLRDIVSAASGAWQVAFFAEGCDYLAPSDARLESCVVLGWRPGIQLPIDVASVTLLEANPELDVLLDAGVIVAASVLVNLHQWYSRTAEHSGRAIDPLVLSRLQATSSVFVVCASEVRNPEETAFLFDLASAISVCTDGVVDDRSHDMFYPS